MQKVILYYLFTPVPDPETTRAWQRNLCERLGLRGRIIVSEHGINGTLGGDIKAVKAYVKEMNAHSRFADIEYKWSDGNGEDFPRLSVKVRPELVTLAPDEQFDVFDSTTGLRPAEWHELLEKNPDITILDARNAYESGIGRFRGAITPSINTFKDVKETVATLDKDKPVATYCTGDVRCEYLSAYMKHLGFREVYHLDGGIVTYGKEYGNDGLWEGACYVFDKRKQVAFGDDVALVGECSSCGNATNDVENCANQTCPHQVVLCTECATNVEQLCPSCAAS